jgi:hypothetical protein
VNTEAYSHEEGLSYTLIMEYSKSSPTGLQKYIMKRFTSFTGARPSEGARRFNRRNDGYT